MNNTKILTPIIFLSLLSCQPNEGETTIQKGEEKEIIENTKHVTREYMDFTTNGITSDSMIGRYDEKGWMHGKWSYYAEGRVFHTNHFLNGEQLRGTDTLKTLSIDLNIPTTTLYSAPK